MNIPQSDAITFQTLLAIFLYQMRDEITNLRNFNGATAEVWEWISNCIPHSIGPVLTYPFFFQNYPWHMYITDITIFKSINFVWICLFSIAIWHPYSVVWWGCPLTPASFDGAPVRLVGLQSSRDGPGQRWDTHVRTHEVVSENFD